MSDPPEEEPDAPRVPVGMLIKLAHDEARGPFLDQRPEDEHITWPVCEVHQCFGRRLDGGNRCYAHAEESARRVRLAAISQGQRVSFQGVRFSAELLAELLAALPKSGDRSQMTAPEFTWATFESEAAFRGDVAGGADFGWATFLDTASFSGARIGGTAHFRGSKFLGRQVAFHSTEFEEALFEAAVFTGFTASFIGARFKRRPHFRSAQFLCSADFSSAEFADGTLFWEPSFRDRLDLSGSSHTWLELRNVSCASGVDLSRVYVTEALRVGDGVTAGQMSLIDVRCTAPVELDTDCENLVVQGAVFEEGLRARLTGEHALFEECAFGKYSTIAGGRELPPDCVGGARHPRLLSLRGTDCRNVVLARLRLGPCLFDRSLNLDTLSIEGTCSFQSPTGAWHSQRGAIAEEHQARARAGERGWYPESAQPPEWMKGGAEHEGYRPHRIETLDFDSLMLTYRGLRAARENSKDEPGAADFYYGEMEMRRKVPRLRGAARPSWFAWSGERYTLVLYWALSGYGLRATRALAWLVALVFACGAVLWWSGLTPVAASPAGGRSGLRGEQIRRAPPATFSRGVVTALEGATGLDTDPRYELTTLGRATRVALRILGPLLIGLTLLALRARVKR